MSDKLITFESGINAKTVCELILETGRKLRTEHPVLANDCSTGINLFNCLCVKHYTWLYLVDLYKFYQRLDGSSRTSQLVSYLVI